MAQPIQGHRVRSSAIIDAIEQQQRSTAQLSWRSWASVVSPSWGSAARIAARLRELGVRVCAPVKGARPEVLNDYSMEAFVQCCSCFIVALCMLLYTSTQGAPWWLTLTAGLAISRGLAFPILAVLTCSRPSLSGMRATLARGVPNMRFLDACAHVIALCGAAAMVPPGTLTFCVLLPGVTVQSYVYLTVTVLGSITAAAVIECALTAVFVAVAVRGVSAAFVVGNRSWSASAVAFAASGAAARVVGRQMLTRGYALHNGITGGLVLGLWQSLDKGGSTLQWVSAVRAWVYVLPGLLFATTAVCLLGAVGWAAEWADLSRAQARLKVAEAALTAALGSAAPVRPSSLVRADACRVKLAACDTVLLLAGATASALHAGMWLLFLAQLDIALLPLAVPGKDATTALRAASRVDEPWNAGGAGATGATIMLACWCGIQLSGMTGLILIARALQSSWDAEDAEDNTSDSTSTSQSAAAAAARRSVLMGAAAAPTSVQRCSEGLYKRTEEDARARSLGLHLVTNPLHYLRDVREAVARRTRAGSHFSSRVSGPPTPPPTALHLRSVQVPLLPLSPLEGLTRPVHVSLSPSFARSVEFRVEPPARKGERLGPLVTNPLVAMRAPVALGQGTGQGSGEAGDSGSAIGVAMPSLQLHVTGSTPAEAHPDTHRRASFFPDAAWGSVAGLASPVAAVASALRALPRLTVTRASGGSSLAASTASAGLAVSLGMTPRNHPARPPCFICFDAPADAVFMDCGHAGACLLCATTVVRGSWVQAAGGLSRTAGSGTCPICRAPVLQVLRVGPDTLSADGSVVALVLPADYWQRET